MENEVKTAVRLSATIYACAGSGSPTGPFGWCTRIVTPEAVHELAEASGDVNFSHLYTVGTIAAMDALPEGCEVHVVCSDRNAISRFNIAEDVALGRNRKAWKGRPEAILRLCRDLHRAIRRHTKVTTEVVSQGDAKGEQLQAQLRVTQVVDEFLAEADFDEPAPDRSTLRLVRAAEPKAQANEYAEDNKLSSEQPTAGLSARPDLPW